MRHPMVRCARFALLFFWITASTAAAQNQQPGATPTTAAIAGATITEWKGDIRLSLPGQAASRPIRGESLPPGTILDTGSGRLLLHLNDGSQLLIHSHTRLQIQQPSVSDPTYFQLLLGRIRALISKRTGGAVPFELGTPSAVIAVRGTEFDVEVNPHNVTEVDVADGVVEVYGRNAGGRSVLLQPGFSTRVAMDGDPEQPEPTHEIRPEVERPEPGESEAGGKSELEAEFQHDDTNRESEVSGADVLKTIEMQEVSETPSLGIDSDGIPGPEPQ